MRTFKKALISVSNKKGLDIFAKTLNENGTQIISTGGTAKYIENLGIPVTQVSEQTGFPEVMDGRVKTLHPKIHMALLSRENHDGDLATLADFELEPFDLVVGNLYPFEEALKNNPNNQAVLIENIDIGGPSFLRAAAKNFERITVVCDPEDYEWVMSQEDLSFEDRKRLSAKVFFHTSNYDSLIARTFLPSIENKEISVSGKKVFNLRYGENPHQEAAWFQFAGSSGLHEADILQGKALSYNNLLDLDAAVKTLRSFQKSKVCVSVKHLNPCGIGIADQSELAIERSLKADPMSVFGGIVAVNDKIEKEGAQKLTALFLECVVAPDYSTEALEIFHSKKNLRILKWPHLMKENPHFQYKSIDGGFLTQSKDDIVSWSDSWQILGETPNEDIKKAISLAWLSCAHLKSNAISIANSEMTLGLGMGQVNRVDAVSQAIERYFRFHGEQENVVLASDAFFPFPDSIEQIAKAKIKWVIQPGGSIKDNDVFECAQKNKVNLIITGQRHFSH